MLETRGLKLDPICVFKATGNVSSGKMQPIALSPAAPRVSSEALPQRP